MEYTPRINFKRTPRGMMAHPSVKSIENSNKYYKGVIGTSSTKALNHSPMNYAQLNVVNVKKELISFSTMNHFTANHSE